MAVPGVGRRTAEAVAAALHREDAAAGSGGGPDHRGGARWLTSGARGRGRHRAVRGGPEHRRQVPGGPRLLRRRQPAAGADRDDGRPRQPHVRRGHPDRGGGRRAQPGVLHRPAQRDRRAGRAGLPAAGAVPRGRRRRAGPPVRERPPAAPAAGRRPAGRRHRRRAGAAVATCTRWPTWSSTPAASPCTSCAGRSSASSAAEAPPALRATVLSFGFKYGLPLDADLVADVRFLPNPHWIPELRPHTGQDPDVRDYVLSPGGRRPVPRRLRRAAARWSAPATSGRASAT